MFIQSSWHIQYLDWLIDWLTQILLKISVFYVLLTSSQTSLNSTKITIKFTYNHIIIAAVWGQPLRRGIRLVRYKYLYVSLVLLCVPFPLARSWMGWGGGGDSSWHGDMMIAGIHEPQMHPSSFRLRPLRSICCISMASLLSELP